MLSDAVVRSLASRGFRRYGQRFGVRSEIGWGVIQLQSRTTPYGPRWTANLGVSLDVIANALRRTPLASTFGASGARPPSETQCHWRDRLGFHGPAASDRWWNLAEDREADEFAESVLRDGVPAVMARLDHRRLLDGWMQGPDEYLGEGLTALFAIIAASGLADEAA